MHNVSPDPLADTSTPPAQRGFGLLQVMLVLMLAGVAVAAATLLLNAKRPLAQASNQQHTLRWADEALTAYAAAHGRLPCPASRWSEEPSSVLESCVDDGSAGSPQAVGFLPVAVLPGAMELGAGIGPIRYSVSRGVIATDPAGAQHRQPALSDTGDAYIPVNEQGEAFEDYVDPTAGLGNGLDFCAALGQNAVSGGIADAYATTRTADQQYNLAYGLVAAGITGNEGNRFDSTASAALPSPAKPGDVDYDDRTLARTFAELAPLVGCRQYAAPNAMEAPSSVALLSMDVLAGAVANHATVIDFQDTNEGNGEAQVRDATFAQVMAITSIVLSSLTLVDSIQSAVFHGVTLGIDTAICIASLGIVCAPLGKDIIANILSVGAMIQSISALVQNTVALVPIGLALDANVKARDRAKESGQRPDTTSVEGVLKSMEKMLYGADATVCETKTDPTTGLPIQRRDPAGELIFNDAGIPQYECEEKTGFQPGLKQDVESAKVTERNMVAAEQVYYVNRILPFEDASLASLMVLGPSAAKYKRTTCEYTGSGPYKNSNGNCVAVIPPEPAGWSSVTRFLPNALQDAKLRRGYAQRWTVLQREANDMKRAIDQKTANQTQWLGLVAGAEKDAENVCRGANNPDSMQICKNSRQQVHYMKTCTYTLANPDGSTRVFNELSPGAGEPINYDAQCTPMIDLDLQRAKDALANKERDRDATKRSYDRQSSPYLRYPTSWNNRRVVIDTSVPTFTWDTSNVWRYNELPIDGANGVHLISTENVVSGDACDFLRTTGQSGSECSRYPYSRAYGDWLQAKEGADKAITNRTQTEARFKELEAKYLTLQNAAGPGSGNEEALAVGAPALLLKADTRGAVGPARPAVATP